MAAAGLETSALTDVALPVALAVIMFGMGMSLTSLDFRRVATVPRAVLFGLVAQLVVLPLLAIGVAVAGYYVLGMGAMLVYGILVLACCPGGATSNLLTYLARADAALSVTLTSIASLASAITAPLAFLGMTYVLAGTTSVLEVSFVDMAKLVGVIVAAPILLGMQVRRANPGFANRAERPFRIASVALFALIVAGAIAENRENFWQLAASSVPAALLLNALALGSGLLIGRLARLSAAQSRAVAIEVGFQNGTLGIALAVTQLHSAEAAVFPAFYSLVMFATGGAIAWVWGADPQARTLIPAPNAPSLEANPSDA